MWVSFLNVCFFFVCLLVLFFVSFVSLYYGKKGEKISHKDLYWVFHTHLLQSLCMIRKFRDLQKQVRTRAFSSVMRQNRILVKRYLYCLNFPGGSGSKASVYNVGDPGLSPGQGRSAGEGNGNPLQYYCLENHMDRGAWQATVYGVVKSRTRLSDFPFLSLYSIFVL